MKCLLFIIISWSISAAEDICFRGHLHQKTSFRAVGMKPYSQRATDTQNGILYYVYYHPENQNSYINALTLPDLQRDWLFSIDIKLVIQLSVDQYTGDLYIVANNDTSRIALDLFRYDKKAKEVTQIADKIYTAYSDASKLYAYKNQVFWIDRYRRMFRYNKGRVGMHNIKLEAYAEDLDGSIYFIKDKDKYNVYKVRKGEKIQLRFVATDVVTDLIRDAKGKVYVFSYETLKFYEISDEEGRLLPVSDALPSASYIFDQANDIIFTDQNSTDRFEKYTQTLKPCEYKN